MKKPNHILLIWQAAIVGLAAFFPTSFLQAGYGSPTTASCSVPVPWDQSSPVATDTSWYHSEDEYDINHEVEFQVKRPGTSSFFMFESGPGGTSYPDCQDYPSTYAYFDGILPIFYEPGTGSFNCIWRALRSDNQQQIDSVSAPITNIQFD